MPGIAFVFPGQGSQYPGMGKELAENYPQSARIFAQADSILGYKVSDICFKGPKEKLDQTEYAQPAILTCSLAALEVVKQHNINPFMVAGLSLGEYTALVAAEAISLEEALPLVQVRARLMQNAVPADKGAMAAVLGADNQLIMNACNEAGGTVVIANYNCPGQAAISGEKEAVARASGIISAAGGRVVPLSVSVPSHSPLMNEAAMQLQPYLAAINWRNPSFDIISNVNARANQAAEFSELLVQQLFSPVLWEQSIRYMLDKVDYFIEIGPGSVLTGLIKRMDRNRILGQVDDLKSLENVLKKVKAI